LVSGKTLNFGGGGQHRLRRHTPGHQGVCRMFGLDQGRRELSRLHEKDSDFKDIVLSPTELATWIDAAVKILGDARDVLEA
jgi:hypothetical protein